MTQERMRPPGWLVGLFYSLTLIPPLRDMQATTTIAIFQYLITVTHYMQTNLVPRLKACDGLFALELRSAALLARGCETFEMPPRSPVLR